ncbi:hypothetical protein ACU21_06845 [Actinobaculum suis]|nr:hypothetical protein ACU20_01770 [Actinobaculum suis]OCA94425.1 hypothetical protein ACU21_06845 [Actinobaculum suis]
MPVIKGVLFDKDGTLLELTIEEPARQLVEEAIAQAGLNETEATSFREKMGFVGGRLQLNSLIVAGSIGEQAACLAPLLGRSFEQTVQYVDDHYRRAALEENIMDRLMDGATEVVRELAGQGYVLGVVTNDHHEATKQILEETGLAPYFSFIGAADRFPAKPHTASLNAFCESFALSAQEVVYVGDSAVDIEYAQSTRAAIGFDLRMGGQEYLEKADYVITHLRQVPSIISELNAQETAKQHP